jgi:thiosulfate reductase cytochrome b subunit
MTNEERDRLLIKLDVTQDGIVERLDKFEETFVTLDSFEPVQSLVYGGVRVVLAAVITAVAGIAAWAKADTLMSLVK